MMCYTGNPDCGYDGDSPHPCVWSPRTLARLDSCTTHEERAREMGRIRTSRAALTATSPASGEPDHTADDWAEDAVDDRYDNDEEDEQWEEEQQDEYEDD